MLSAFFLHPKGVKLAAIAALGRLETGMTLALIVCICVFPSASGSLGPSGLWVQAAAQEAARAQSADSRPGVSQSNPGSAQSSPPTGPQTPASAAPATPGATPAPSSQKVKTKHRRRRKTSKVDNAADCAKSNSAAANTPAPELGTAPDGTAAAKPPLTNCPPPKTVVHDGSTTEPAIQLVGGAGAQTAAGQRSTTDQLVGSTEENLKKIAGLKLDSNQQEMLKQVQQFLDQSKAAVAAGDIERGHNLAMKAHLLSEELAKP